MPATASDSGHTFLEVRISQAYVEVESMYGTIMRAKVKAGRRAEYEASDARDGTPTKRTARECIHMKSPGKRRIQTVSC